MAREYRPGHLIHRVDILHSSCLFAIVISLSLSHPIGITIPNSIIMDLLLRKEQRFNQAANWIASRVAKKQPSCDD